MGKVISNGNEDSLDNVAKVAALFPEYRDAKGGGVDFEKLRLMLGDGNATTCASSRFT